MNDQSAYILGGGYFGSRAFSFLKSRFKPTNITVVDANSKKLEKIITEGGNAVVMEAISFLQTSKEKMDFNSWIIPAVPIHVAYEWLRRELKSETLFKTITIPEYLDNVMPNPIHGFDGQFYASNADFRCPDDCAEPEQYCAVTGEPRPQNLHNTLAGLNIPGYHSICIVSSQLAPGVGGFQLNALLETSKEIKSNPGKFIISTSCKCHCVINAFMSIMP